MCLNFKVNSCLFPMIFFFIPWKSLIIIFLHLYSIASSLYSRVFLFWVFRSLYGFCAIVPFFYARKFIVLVSALYPSILWRKQYTNCKVCPYAFCNSHVNSSAWNKWQDKFKSLVQQQQKTCGTSLSTKVQFVHFIASMLMRAQLGMCISVAHLGQQWNILNTVTFFFHVDIYFNRFFMDILFIDFFLIFLILRKDFIVIIHAWKWKLVLSFW